MQLVISDSWNFSIHTNNHVPRSLLFQNSFIPDRATPHDEHIQALSFITSTNGRSTGKPFFFFKIYVDFGRPLRQKFGYGWPQKLSAYQNQNIPICRNSPLRLCSNEVNAIKTIIKNKTERRRKFGGAPVEFSRDTKGQNACYVTRW